MPTFLDKAWFAKRSEGTIEQQKWFIHVGSGGSVRDIKTPVHLRRRRAHEFMLRNNRESIAHNLRWIQVLGMSGDQVTAKAVQSTRLGRHLDPDEFWSTVVLFLSSNPMIDPALVGPVIDYVHHMRYARRRIVREGGGVDEAPAPQPSFTMKGRSATKLLRQVEAWHSHLARVQDVVFQSWQTCGLRPYELDDESVAGWPSSGTFCVKPENEGARAQMSCRRRDGHRCVVAPSRCGRLARSCSGRCRPEHGRGAERATQAAR